MTLHVISNSGSMICSADLQAMRSSALSCTAQSHGHTNFQNYVHCRNVGREKLDIAALFGKHWSTAYVWTSWDNLVWLKRFSGMPKQQGWSGPPDTETTCQMLLPLLNVSASSPPSLQCSCSAFFSSLPLCCFLFQYREWKEEAIILLFILNFIVYCYYYECFNVLILMHFNCCSFFKWICWFKAVSRFESTRDKDGI